MMKYPKIDTLWKRDEKTHKIIPGELSKPEFAVPKTWVLSEKVDGTNVRAIYDCVRHVDEDDNFVHRVQFRGKTDDAMLHPILLEKLNVLFSAEKMRAVFPDVEEVILFGEGYGTKVNGIKYGVDADFILFDVAVKNIDEERSFKVPYWWLTRANVKDVAQKLGVQVVPELAVLPLAAAIEKVKMGESSVVASPDVIGELKMEGVVARTEPMLLCRDGSPLMWKLKLRDFR